MSDNAAVCIVSGGLDSVCTAAYLREKGYELYMLTFAYGQRAEREITIAKHFAKILKAKEHRVVDISFMKSLYGRSNVLTSTGRLPENFNKSLVVPVRNAIFIVVAGAWAMSIGAKLVAYGAHTGDIANYPDCRPGFVKSITETLNIAEADSIKEGTRQPVTVWSPAVEGLDKSALLQIGYKILGSKIFSTWSCYSNGVRTLHCGKCESCINRKKAFTGAKIDDRTSYATKDSQR